MLTERINGNDVGMVERRDQFGFSFESFRSLLAGDGVSQDFKRHRSFEGFLIGAVDHAHRALADHFANIKISQLLRHQIRPHSQSRNHLNPVQVLRQFVRELSMSLQKLLPATGSPVLQILQVLIKDHGDLRIVYLISGRIGIELSAQLQSRFGTER